MTEPEKRLHRCCFTGHRPEKLLASEEEVKAWLNTTIDKAIADGYITFITGCAMGVDIWAGQIVLEKREKNPALHLIAATPWPGFPNKWGEGWKKGYAEIIRKADFIKIISQTYHDGIFQERNIWMVNHCNRVIAYYNGTPGGTKNTIDYAQKVGVDIVAGP